MANVGGLVDSITGGFTNPFGTDVDPLSYPAEFKDVTNQPGYKDGSWKRSGSYIFEVVSVDKESGGVIPSWDSESATTKGWLPFNLQINPQSLNQDEIFAIEVTPTFRGVVVEHQGSVLKDINISGTTGISPRSSGRINKKTGKAILGLGRSGYEEFNELRSYFRAYAEAKRLENDDLYELRLVFHNYKDNEHLFVEPQKFSMKRDSSSRTLYKYDISLKAIGVFEVLAVKPSSNLILDIFAALDTLDTALEFADELIQAGIGLIKSIERDIISTITGPLDKMRSIVASLNSGIKVVKEFGSGIGPSINASADAFSSEVSSLNTNSGGAVNLSDSGLTRDFLNQMAFDSGRVRDNLAESIGVDMTNYNSITGRTSTSIPVTRESTVAELQTMHGLMVAARSMSLLLAHEDSFDDDIEKKYIAVGNFYENEVSLSVPNSVRVVRIKGGDTIHSLSARELGSPAKYRELIVLNNLVAPYISDTASTGVLVSGDEIYIPQNKSVIDLGIRNTPGYPVTSGLTPSEKQMGVDLRLAKNNDIALTNTGDFDLRVGTENYVQAIVIKLNLEPGGLQRHPGLGVDLRIGNKTTTNKAMDVKNQITKSMLSDVRTESVPSLDVDIEDGVFNIVMLIKPKNLDQNLPIPVKLNAN